MTRRYITGGVYSKGMQPGENDLSFPEGVDDEIKLAKTLLRRIAIAEQQYNRNLVRATRQNTKKGEKREKPLYAPVYAKLIIRFLRSIGRLTEIRGSLSCGEGVDKISKEMREFAAQAFQSVPRPAGGLPAAETEAEKAFS